jgi:hypothetical protein
MVMYSPFAITSAGGGQGNYNEYFQAVMPYATPAIIMQMIVPAGKKFYISQIIGWGDVDGEFTLQVDGITKGGGRASPSDRTLDIYFSSPIVANDGQLVQIYGEQHFGSSKTLKLNLIGDLI